MRASLSPFITKLLYLLNEKKYEKYIRWNEEGTSILIINPSLLAEFVLPENFKHNNLNSFIRQLNKYNFSKRKISAKTRSIYGNETWEFYNPYFIRNRADIIRNITRKKIIRNGVRGSDAPTVSENHNSNSLSDSDVPQVFFERVIEFAEKTKKYFDFLLTEITFMKKLLGDINNKQIQIQRFMMLSHGFPYLKILIAEDNPDCTFHAHRSCQYFGYDPEIAENTQDLLEKINTDNFELIILSSDLPNIHRVIERIRICNKDIPIILISSVYYQQKDQLKKFKGVNSILYKPYTPEELNNEIKNTFKKFSPVNKNY